jgi:hypothetical protein
MSINFDAATMVVFAVKGFTGTLYQTKPFDTNSSLPATASATIGVSGNPEVSGVSTDLDKTMIFCVEGNSATTTSMSTHTGTGFTFLTGIGNASGAVNDCATAVEYEVVSNPQNSITAGYVFSVKGWDCIADALSEVGGAPPFIPPGKVKDKGKGKSKEYLCLVNQPRRSTGSRRRDNRSASVYSAASATLTPSLFVNTKTFYTPVVAARSTLLPALFNEAKTYYAPAVSGRNTLTPALFSGTRSFYVPVVSARNTLTPALFSESHTYYSPTTSTNYTLVPSKYNETNQFYALVVTAGSVTLAPPLFGEVQTFIASYHTFDGHYSADSNYFATPHVNGPLTALDNASSGGNGVYVYFDSFPAFSFNATNYWVDVVFAAAGAPSSSSLFLPSDVPTIVDADDTNSVELGVKFKASTQGSITGIRFYKGSQNTGTHIAHLWSTAGTLLASETFADETASGWQQVDLATPFNITTGSIYSAPEVSVSNTIVPSEFLESNVFYGPTVVGGAVSVSPPLFSEAHSYYVPIISSSETITPQLFSETNTFYSLTAVSKNFVTPSLFNGGQVLYVPLVTASYAITPQLFSESHTYYTPTVVSGVVTLAPSLFVETHLYYVPIVMSRSVVAPAPFGEVQTYYTPAVTEEDSLRPIRFVEINVTYTVVIVKTNAVDPPHFEELNILRTPSVESRFAVAPSRFIESNIFYTSEIQQRTPVFVNLQQIYSPEIGLIPFVNTWRILGSDAVPTTILGSDAPLSLGGRGN